MIVLEEPVGWTRWHPLGAAGGRRLGEDTFGEKTLCDLAISANRAIGMREGSRALERLRLGKENWKPLALLGDEQRAAWTILDLIAGFGAGAQEDPLLQAVFTVFRRLGRVHVAIDEDAAVATADLAIDRARRNDVERALRGREIAHASF